MVKGKQSLEEFLKKEGITEQEFKAALNGARTPKKESQKLPISDKHYKYGYFSDPHIGHKEFKNNLWDKMCVLFKKEGLDFIVTPGDHLEGMSGRPGHIYELDQIGFQKQIEYAVHLYKQLPNIPIYGIDGNHDGWYFKKNNGGVIVGRELENMVKNYHNLGQYEGQIIIGGKTILSLFHANDGTAYATSYKLEKLIDSFEGGKKPNIVHSGHYHKALYIFKRGVHGFESGTLCGQSEFMKGRKIPAHLGFGIVDVYVDDKGVDRIKHQFIPYYD